MNKTITIAPNSAHPLTAHRIGYGTMRLPGPGVWGEPANRSNALKILQTALAEGTNFLDTADFYGDDVTNRLIAEALYPYQQDLIICTKVGGARKPDKSWILFSTLDNLRTSIERNLGTLKQEQIQLVHFRAMPHAEVPLADSLGAMYDMQREGKIQHVGVSNVIEEELQLALSMGEVA